MSTKTRMQNQDGSSVMNFLSYQAAITRFTREGFTKQEVHSTLNGRLIIGFMLPATPQTADYFFSQEYIESMLAFGRQQGIHTLMTMAQRFMTSEAYRDFRSLEEITRRKIRDLPHRSFTATDELFGFTSNTSKDWPRVRMLIGATRRVSSDLLLQHMTWIYPHEQNP